MWRKGMQKGKLVTLCNACGIRLKRGKCCPYCQVTYNDADAAEAAAGGKGASSAAGWLSCACCSRWVHKACHLEHNGAAALDNGAKLLCPECQRRKLTRQQKPAGAARRRSAPSAKARAAEVKAPARPRSRAPKRVALEPATSSEDSIGSSGKAPKRARTAAAKVSMEEIVTKVPTKRRTSVSRRRKVEAPATPSPTMSLQEASPAAAGAHEVQQAQQAGAREQAQQQAFEQTYEQASEGQASEHVCELSAVDEANLLDGWALDAPPGGWGGASASPSMDDVLSLRTEDDGAPTTSYCTEATAPPAGMPGPVLGSCKPEAGVSLPWIASAGVPNLGPAEQFDLLSSDLLSTDDIFASSATFVSGLFA